MAKENKPLMIFLAGQLQDSERIGKMIHQREFDFYAADGGYKLAEKWNLPLKYILGDFDSSEKPCSENLIVYPSEKDQTDSELALDLALKEGYGEIWMVAPFGGRMDHTFANLCLMEKAMEYGAVLYLYDGSNLSYLLKEGTYSFEGDYRYLSFFAWSDTAVLSLDGFQYPLKQYCLSRSTPLGISNVAMESNPCAIIENGKVLCICIEKDNLEEV